jgi:hypothetical protein
VALVMRRGGGTALVPSDALPVLSSAELAALLRMGNKSFGDDSVTQHHLVSQLWDDNGAVLMLPPHHHSRVIVIGHLAGWQTVYATADRAAAWSKAVRAGMSALTSDNEFRPRRRANATKATAAAEAADAEGRLRLQEWVEQTHDSIHAVEDDDGTVITPWLSSASWKSVAAHEALALAATAGLVSADDHPVVVASLSSSNRGSSVNVLLHPGQCLPFGASEGGEELERTPTASGDGVDTETTLVRRFFPRDLPTAASDFRSVVTSPASNFAFCLRVHRRGTFAPSHAQASGGILPDAVSAFSVPPLSRPVLRLEAVYRLPADGEGSGYGE